MTREPSVLTPLTLGCALFVASIGATLNRVGVEDATFTIVAGVALGIVGSGLVLGTWFGRAGGLIPIGLLLSVVVVVSHWLDVESARVGELTNAPTRIGQLHEIDFLAGELTVDLNDLVVPETGPPPTIKIDGGVGHITVLVPPTLAADITTSIKIGEITMESAPDDGPRFTRTDEGLAISIQEPLDEPAVIIDIDLRVGAVVVER